MFKDFIFLERGEGREKGGAQNIEVTEKRSLLHAPNGTWPATQVCALTGNRGIELVTFQFPGQCPTHGDTLARASADFSVGGGPSQFLDTCSLLTRPCTASS